MNKKISFVIGTIFLALFLAGCIGTKEPPEKLSTQAYACIKLCKEKKDAGVDLSSGPCLSNEIAKDWVCDVAHSPRIEVDNNPANQCEAFRNGTARHFVEVDLNCNLLKTY